MNVIFSKMKFNMLNGAKTENDKAKMNCVFHGPSKFRIGSVGRENILLKHFILQAFVYVLMFYTIYTLCDPLAIETGPRDAFPKNV